jgi:hypothetical protein
MVSSSAQITELAPLMAYTASIKGAAIVSSSQQVQNYFTFAKTGSANTFYGNQSISGSSLVTGSVGIGTSTIYSGAKLHTVGGILAVEPTNGNTNSEILVGRGLSSLGTSAGSGITSKINFAFEGSNDNFYQELGFITTTANQTRVNSSADFYISTKNAGASSPTEKLRLTNTGVLRLAGAGIQFNGDTAEANSLDDYEEGTWTPVFAALTVGGTTTYANRSGTYTKIGNTVFLRWGIKLASTTGAIGTMCITGLPFAGADWGAYQSPHVSVSTGNLSSATYASQARMFIQSGGSVLEGRISTNADTAWNVNEFDGDEWIIGEIFYNVS